MKKFISISLSLIMLFTLCACKEVNSKKPKNNDEKIKICATIFPPFDFARQIAKDNAEIIMLLPTGAESHSYEPTLEDVANVQSCDIFIYSGGDTDSFATELLDGVDTSKIEVIKLIDEVELKSNHSHLETEHEHKNAQVDEHIWTSPKNAIKLANRIGNAIIKVDPKNEKEYRKNLENYVEDLDELDALFESTVKNGNLDCIAFADRFPFLYLAEDYGIRHFEALDGCTSDTEPTLTALSNLQKAIEKEGIETVFYVEFSSGTVADKICKMTGASKLLFHSCHNISKEELEEGETYLSLMQKNAERLKTALK